LPLEKAVQIIGAQQRRRPPRILHQFWDIDPPRQIRRLFRHCSKVCKAAGIEHRIWDDASARALLADGFDDIVLRAYDTAPHPSMQSDVLRLAILHRFGGVYLDADMALRAKVGPDLWATFTEALLFKWNLEDRKNTPTWCLGCQPGHDLFLFALMHVSTTMEAEVRHDPKRALKRALALGPGSLTQAVGGWLDVHGGEGVTVLDVSDAYKMVQNGPQLLKAPLQYKKTALHWLQAGKNAG
jgi:hypothetical protein